MTQDRLTEWHTASVATQLTIKRRLLDTQTPFQNLEVVETEAFGHAFLLDGHLMSAEGDEWFYPSFRTCLKHYQSLDSDRLL